MWQAANEALDVILLGSNLAMEGGCQVLPPQLDAGGGFLALVVQPVEDPLQIACDHLSFLDTLTRFSGWIDDVVFPAAS